MLTVRRGHRRHRVTSVVRVRRVSMDMPGEAATGAGTTAPMSGRRNTGSMPAPGGIRCPVAGSSQDQDGPTQKGIGQDIRVRDTVRVQIGERA